MIYYSAQNIDGTFEIPVSLSTKFNDLNINSGPVTFTADGNYAVFSRNSKVANNKDEYPMQLYSATTDEDGKWKNVQLINFCRNNSNYMHPAISADGQHLFFVAKRGKGFGGTDIYVSKRKSENEWGKPENLGPLVNTALNEGFPFVHADGRVFFSSKGHPGYGGFDLFVTQKDASGNWAAPTNLGRPVNSSMDDVSFFLFPDSTGGFFSSAVNKGHDDIYLFSLEEEEEIYVRFEDDKTKTDLVNQPSNNVENTINTSVDSAEETAFQTASEVTNNEPFDSGQSLENTEEVLKSDEQSETITNELVQPNSSEQDVTKNIISDTQIAAQEVSQPTNPTPTPVQEESLSAKEPNTPTTITSAPTAEPKPKEVSITTPQEENVASTNNTPPASNTPISSSQTTDTNSSSEVGKIEMQETGWNKKYRRIFYCFYA